MVRLGTLGSRYPAQLSGGQQQRVALARALVFEPQLVLMDEPLGALDKQLREHMQIELKELHRRLGVTFVYVTHDQSEALDHVGPGGRLQRWFRPAGGPGRSACTKHRPMRFCRRLRGRQHRAGWRVTAATSTSCTVGCPTVAGSPV